MEQTKTHSGGIVCATRGGEGSEPAVQYAIAQASAHGLPLTFLYIADLEFIKYSGKGHIVSIAEEIRKMGEFIMLTLVERARENGVEADLAVRVGRFHDMLSSYLVEARPTMLVLGFPQTVTGHFNLERLRALAQKIEAETGVPIELVQGCDESP
jgi:hypothetical protein